MYISKIQTGLIAILFLTSCAVQKTDPALNREEVTRIIKTLSADDMQGRGSFTPGIDRAAAFIEDEFRKAGLQPLDGENSFRQEFKVTRVSPGLTNVLVEGKSIDPANVLVMSDRNSLSFDNNS